MNFELRFLTAIGDMLDGDLSKTFTEEQADQYVEKVGVFRMTEQEFEEYRKKVIARVEAHNASKSN